MKVSHKLVEGADGTFHVVSGNPDVGYDLAAVTLTPVGHYRRSWQAVHRAHHGVDPEVD